MRPAFRFPRTSILIMVVVLGSVLVAIEHARAVSVGDESAMPIPVLLRFLVMWAVLVAILGGVSYATLRLIGRARLR